MSGSPIHCEVVPIPIASRGYARAMVICFNTPESSQNIVDRNFALEFGKAVLHANELANTNEIDLLVICSAKGSGFVAGADINTLLSCIGPSGSLKIFTDTFKLNCSYCVLESLPIPTIAVINGTVLGAGLELVISCDYRVIDGSVGKQIGQPEVKIGVLPGAGGCFRLPYLIGLRRALPLLLSGELISARRAKKLGLVDALWVRTHCTVGGGASGCHSYDWIEELAVCIDSGQIGVKRFDCMCHAFPLVPAVLSLPDISEEDLLKDSKSFSWQKCDEKALKKFHHRPASSHTLLSPLRYALNFLVYTISAFQVYRKVGVVMPAPYAVLECTWKAYQAPTIRRGVVECSLGFSELVESAVSKSLMTLFLLARKLKKQSMGENKGTVPNPSEVVMVTDGQVGVNHVTKFAQSLLYSDVKVGVVLTGRDRNKAWSKLISGIKNLFKYSVSRGHMTQQTVDNKLCRLRILDQVPDGGDILVLETCLSDIEAKLSHSSGCGQLHLGDPLRKNTFSVEVMWEGPTPVVSLLVSQLGKIPVVTPPCSNIGWKLAVSHWSLAVQVVMETGVNREYLERVLKQGGFIEGPFETIKKLDKDVVLHAVEKCGRGSSLSDYIKHPSIVKHRATPTCTPKPHTLITLFLVNMITTSIDLLTQYTSEGLSADAVDFLCVSGVVHFPPTEGGPINYLMRNGRGQLVTRLRGLECSGNKRMEELVCGLADRLDGGVVNGCGLGILSDEELATVGPTHGVPHLPFPFNAPFYVKACLITLPVILLILITFWF